MAKETYYFSHDYEPTADPKMQALIGEHGAVGYGIYWRIVEMLHSDTTHKLANKEYVFLAIAKQMLTPVEQVKEVVAFCVNVCELFATDETHFWSNRVLRNVTQREELRKKRSNAGKLSAAKRLDISTHVQQRSTKGNKGKERKGKESKGNNNNANAFERFWDLYGKKVDRSKCDAKFEKMKPEDVELIFEKLPAYLEATPDIQYRKNPLTYLNGKCWNDELPVRDEVDRSKYPDWPAGVPFNERNLYYYTNNRLNLMEKVA